MVKYFKAALILFCLLYIVPTFAVTLLNVRSIRLDVFYSPNIARLESALSAKLRDICESILDRHKKEICLKLRIQTVSPLFSLVGLVVEDASILEKMQIILINRIQLRKWSKDETMFMLAHEIGHIFIENDLPRSTHAEIQADEFAIQVLGKEVVERGFMKGVLRMFGTEWEKRDITEFHGELSQRLDAIKNSD